MIVTPPVASGYNLRVVVGDGGYDPVRVRELLDGSGVNAHGETLVHAESSGWLIT